ncbi:TonB-dependent receptor [Sphingobium lactosutens]|uniref:TonB-dependent receptor n=1 Tax=Sphingobium lactosutens TaxID=522773 RepID=UPI0015BAF7F1|nr:TonB-dependent receptor [Sphingobium lactosutens]NWK95866.1 TonB-dependent receptor [Sphingobium lactosutens]
MKRWVHTAVTSMGAMAIASICPSVSAQTAATMPAPQSAAPQEATAADIIVTGFRTSLQKGIDLKRESVGVRDSIVAEDIGKFPEQNVAESLQRIPGVFLSRDGASNEGQRISIRGLGSQYSVTTINGAPVRTTSSQNVGTSTRDFNFDVFPSELFGRVDIYKSPLANLEEGGIGGNIDLQTPRPFDSKGRVIRYAGSANYNSQSKEWTPRASLMLSDTWGNFGALFGVAYARSVNERSGFQSTGGYNSSALASRAYATPAPAPNTTGPFNFDLNFNDPRANLGGLTRDQVANAYLPRFFRVFSSNNERERLGMVGSLQYKSDRLEISVDGIYADLKDQADEFTFGVAVRNSRTVPGTTSLPGRGTNSGLVPIDVSIDEYNNLYGTFANASFINENFFRDARTKFTYGIIRGVYDLTDSLKLSAQINASKSDARYTANRIVSNLYAVEARFDPTGDVTYPTITTPVDVTNPRVYADPALGFSLNREVDKQKTGRIQLDWDAGEWGGVEWSALAGGSRVDTTKSISLQDGSSIAAAKLAGIDVYSYMNPYVQYGALENGGNAGFPSQFATFPRSFVMRYLDANGANAAAPVRLNSAFTAEEQVTSAWIELNAKMDIGGHELRGNIGMRYSDTKTIIDNYLSTGGGNFAPQNREGGYDNWLPSASLAFDITPKLVARASAGKTITRAALANIASGTLVPNVFNGDITVGNPNLRPQVATQFDGSLEWYFNQGGLLSVGGFYKKLKGTATAITDLVTLGSTGLPDSAFNAIALGYPDGNIPDDFLLRRTTYINQGAITLKGLEFAYQQSFTFLPEPFDGLGTIASFTKVFTQGNDFVTSDGTSVSVALVPKTSYSLTAYYEKGPFALRGSYNYRARSGITNINNGNDQIPYNSPQGFLDATMSYKINDAIELRVDALNITNVNSYIYYEDPDGPKGNGKSRRDNSFFNGRTLSFGIRGKF